MITFDQIKTSEPLLGFKEPDGKIREMYVKPISNNAGEFPKYKIYLADSKPEIGNGEMGYVYFYVDMENYNSEFIGMRIDSKFRERRYANLLMSSYIDVCKGSDIYDLTTHQKQRKPEVTHILRKFGYEPDGEVDSDSEIILVRGQNGHKNRLYIPNRQLRRGLEFSRLARENDYVFINSLDGETILDQVYYNQQYRLTDRTKCLSKQCEVKRRIDSLETSFSAFSCKG